MNELIDSNKVFAFNSITSAAIAMGQVETACSTDYIWVCAIRNHQY